MHQIIIYAPNVGGGGGLVLLRELLGLKWSGRKAVAILDRRAEATLTGLLDEDDVIWSRSSVRGRWSAERQLARLTRAGDIVLCFHNLPPMLPNRGRVFCYVQNANLVRLIPQANLSGWLRFRNRIEHAVARLFRGRIERYLVQTPTMAAALRRWYGRNAPLIEIQPFVAVDTLTQGAGAGALGGLGRPHWDFVYVSDGPAHKNHLRLFAAWELLADKGELPSLAVTLHPQRDRHLAERVSELSARGLRIENLGILPHAEVLAAYREAGALIFPSYAESFGIPLLEASDAGLPILAPELDYVRDVCEPAITFDPHSERSIARAVLRFLGRPEAPLPIATAQEFADAVCAFAAGDQPHRNSATTSLQARDANRQQQG